MRSWARVIVFSLLIACASTLRAAEITGQDKMLIAEGTVLEDELYAFGQSLVLGGTVSGDVSAFVSELRVTETATITGSLNLAASTAEIGGQVANNIRAAGSDVTVSAKAAGNGVITGARVLLAGAGEIGRDLFVAGADVGIDGSVGRNLRIAADKARINGAVGGDVRVTASRVSVGPQAVIKGNLFYTSSQPVKIDPGAQIMGKTVEEKPSSGKDFLGPFRWVLRVIGFFALYLVGALLIAVAPRTMVSSGEAVSRSLWMSLVVGLGALIVIPVVIGSMILTVIGFPLALIMFAMYLIMLYISRVVTALAIGQWVLGRSGKPVGSPYRLLFVGLLIFWIVTSLPYIGDFAAFLGLLVGLGALLRERVRFMREMRSEGRI